MHCYRFHRHQQIMIHVEKTYIDSVYKAVGFGCLIRLLMHLTQHDALLKQEHVPRFGFSLEVSDFRLTTLFIVDH